MLAGMLDRFEVDVPDDTVIVKQVAAPITRRLGGEPASATIRSGERSE
jgi:hypothetical protein